MIDAILSTMPMVDPSDHCSIHYLESSYVDPWSPEPETVLLVHGMAESALAWTAWVPHLARRFRVVRVDLPGFGRSRLHSADADVSVAGFATELARFLDVTGIGSAHLVGAKLGGSVVLDLAARFPGRARSVTAVTGPMWAEGEGRIVHQHDISGSVTEHGTARWARDTMARRLGSGVSAAQRDWWVDLMAATDGDLVARAARANATLDLRPRLGEITAPALMITSTGSPLSGGDALGVWRENIKRSRGYLVLPCDGYHVAAAMPDTCAGIVAAFLAGAEPGELTRLANAA